jgi:hypothetical protein
LEEIYWQKIVLVYNASRLALRTHSVSFYLDDGGVLLVKLQVRKYRLDNTAFSFSHFLRIRRIAAFIFSMLDLEEVDIKCRFFAH